MESSNDFRKEKSALEDPGHETGRAQNLCFFHNSKVCKLKLNEKLAMYLWKENHAKIERGNILFITEILIYLNKQTKLIED